MRRTPFSPVPEVAPVASGSERTHGSPQLRRSQSLLDQLTAAGRQNDRDEFDRLFECCFERVFAIAWRITRERARAEVITAQILCKAVIEAP